MFGLFRCSPTGDSANRFAAFASIKFVARSAKFRQRCATAGGGDCRAVPRIPLPTGGATRVLGGEPLRALACPSGGVGLRPSFGLRCSAEAGTAAIRKKSLGCKTTKVFLRIFLTRQCAVASGNLTNPASVFLSGVGNRSALNDLLGCHAASPYRAVQPDLRRLPASGSWPR